MAGWWTTAKMAFFNGHKAAHQPSALDHFPICLIAAAGHCSGGGMQLLLTGSSGWLGRFLAPMLRAHGHDVLGLDVAAGVDTQVIGSVADSALVDRLFREQHFEGVIHAGALHKPDIERHRPQAFIDANVTGTLNLLEAAVKHGVERFVVTSTTSLMITQGIRDERADQAFGSTSRAAR